MIRVAVYAVPEPGSAFDRLGSGWLGRDAFSGEATRPSDPVHDALVAEAARYGFHATLRSPFRPNDGTTLDTLSGRLRALCMDRAAPVIAQLSLARLGQFFALTPDRPEPVLDRLEGDVLDAFEPYRAPLSEPDLARRHPARLTPRQRNLLDRWGYPFVREEFRFHMTVTGPVPDTAEGPRAALEAHFAPVLGRSLGLDGLALFVEPSPGAPFRAHSFHAFAVSPTRTSPGQR